MKILLTVDL